MNTSIPPQEKATTKRAWLLFSIRSALLAGMAAFGIGQINKAQRLANDPACIKLNTCEACAEFWGCNLEKATAFRSSKKKA